MVAAETVFARRLSDMLVLRVTSFSNTTASHLAMSVQDAMSEPHPVEGIVLDLRDNRGGLLRQAVTAADTFLPAGIVAVTTGRDADANHIWRSAEGELAENVPLVILVDGRTASSAEILAAALADRGRAVVVGSSTVGKGLVQTIDPIAGRRRPVRDLEPGAGTAGLADPGSGRAAPGLHQPRARGPAPAAFALAAGFQPMAAAIDRQRTARTPVSSKDVLDIRAACPGAEARAADMEAARALIANPAAYAAALLPPMANQ